jgi:hypothetical protein
VSVSKMMQDPFRLLSLFINGCCRRDLCVPNADDDASFLL